MRTLMGWKPIAGLAGLALFEFDGGVEIRVPGPDKGDVVRNLLEEMGPGVAVAYMGDDSTDERAFRAIRDRGLSLRVSPQWRQTAAQLWLKPPDEVLDFLKQWLEACRGGDVTSGTMAGVAGG